MNHLKMNQQHDACKEKNAPSLYRIGLFAGMNRVTVKTLRYYDEQNLLKPVYVDEESGYRYYEAGQIADLHRILALKNMGFSIEEIQKIIRGGEEKSILQRKKQEILKELAALTVKLSEVESYLAKEEIDLTSPVLIKKLPEVTVCSMKQRITSYDMLFELMPEMGLEMEGLNCECAVPDYCFTHYLEPGEMGEDILVETCQAVTEKKEDTERVTFQTLPEVPEAACIFHRGSYDTFSKSYAAVLQFIEEKGYEICGNIRESYIDGVWNKETPEEWLSEIQIPVRKRTVGKP